MWTAAAPQALSRTSLKGSDKGSLLLLLMSSLLLCKNVASTSLCPSGVDCQESLSKLFDEMITLSLKMQNVSLEMFQKFNTLYSKDAFYFLKIIHQCHTASIPTPLNKEQALAVQHEDLISMVIRLMRSWEDPLIYLILEAYHLPPITDTLLYNALEIGRRIRPLLEGLEKIASQIDPEFKDSGDFAVWSGLQSLQSADEEPLLFAFYNLLRCLSRDTNKTVTFLKFLKCQVVYNGNC
ncbi:prolactin-like [Erethizon dorsatum]